ncbi:MAG: phosphotransferase [Halioglobus sp.]|nr:phosphotransferase [Halioglobus sp.]
MSSRRIPKALLPWAMSVLGLRDGDLDSHLAAVAGDASNRRYFRFEVGSQTYVLAESPPSTEKNEAFLQIGAVLDKAGVKVPAVLGVDLNRGFLLLEDLGDQQLWPALNNASADSYYDLAFDVLAKMAAVKAIDADLVPYDRSLLGEELSRFQQWFVRGLLGYNPNPSEQVLLEKFFERLISSALEQPSVLVHRDFHSRNLMLFGAKGLAVIDFQDAVMGPVTYDLVSLLRDCYIQWPLERVQAWVRSYRERLCLRGLLAHTDDALFLRWFDWMGLQRHIKVLGTFSRLYLRDGKSNYLADLPLVIQYVLQIADQYADKEPLFADFSIFFSQRLEPLVMAQSWRKVK